MRRGESLVDKDLALRRRRIVVFVPALKDERKA